MIWLRWGLVVALALALGLAAYDQWLSHRLGLSMAAVDADRQRNLDDGEPMDWRLRLDGLLMDECMALTGTPGFHLLPASGKISLPAGLRATPQAGGCRQLRGNAVLLTEGR